MRKSISSAWHYNAIPETYEHGAIGCYHTFGLEVTDCRFSTVLHDVSIYVREVEHMARLFNEYQLSPIHLKDAVEDMLA